MSAPVAKHVRVLASVAKGRCLPPLVLSETCSTATAHKKDKIVPNVIDKTVVDPEEFLSSPPLPRKVKTGVLLLNMGGPANTDEVGDFLLRLFSDKDLIPLPLQKYIAPRIAARRTPRIQAQYEAIGGGSPIKHWTNKQGAAMLEKLRGTCPEFGPYKYYVGFSYAKPLIQDAIEEMESDGVSHAVAFTQYPQYSCSTTGSVLNAIARHYLGGAGPPTPPTASGTNSSSTTIASRSNLSNSNIARWSVVDRWATHPGLVEAFAENIRKELQEFPPGVRKDVVILFSAHSLPMSVVNRGDPYPYEVGATVHRVMEALRYSHCYRLVWQSKVGPMPWLAPSTEQALKLLPKQGRKDVLLVPIAFVNDHIETLYELDQEYMGEVAQEAMAEVVKNHLATLADMTHAPPPPQLFLRCPGCTNDSCKQMRGFWSHFYKT